MGAALVADDAILAKGVRARSVAGMDENGFQNGGAAAASNPFRSGTPYGQSPPGTFEATPPAVLWVGTDYQVAIYRWVGEPGQPNQFGSATFRP
jgi:hypothetical protein